MLMRSAMRGSVEGNVQNTRTSHVSDTVISYKWKGQPHSSQKLVGHSHGGVVEGRYRDNLRSGPHVKMPMDFFRGSRYKPTSPRGRLAEARLRQRKVCNGSTDSSLRSGHRMVNQCMLRQETRVLLAIVANPNFLALPGAASEQEIDDQITQCLRPITLPGRRVSLTTWGLLPGPRLSQTTSFPPHNKKQETRQQTTLPITSSPLLEPARPDTTRSQTPTPSGPNRRGACLKPPHSRDFPKHKFACANQFQVNSRQPTHYRQTPLLSSSNRAGRN